MASTVSTVWTSCRAYTHCLQEIIVLNISSSCKKCAIFNLFYLIYFVSYTSVAEIAQLGERQTEDLKVPGSNPESSLELWKIPGLGNVLFISFSFSLLLLLSFACEYIRAAFRSNFLFVAFVPYSHCRNYKRYLQQDRRLLLTKQSTKKIKYDRPFPCYAPSLCIKSRLSVKMTHDQEPITINNLKRCPILGRMGSVIAPPFCLFATQTVPLIFRLVFATGSPIIMVVN